MRKTTILAAAASTLFAAAALAAPTVTLALQSSKNGMSVSPGSTVDWTITVSVSMGDNVGLALVACDLLQKDTNPAFFDIPPGDPNSIGTVMDDFSRPLGVSNPGENSFSTGYIGVQRGTAGHKNLVQIGGGQNTFGAAGPAGIGQDFNVNALVGQGGSAQTVVSGAFPAPSATGSYTFELANAVSNVLVQQNNPPFFSPVTSATVVLNPGSVSFTVGSLTGDLNCDGEIDNFDINPFVLALTNPAAYQAAYPNCNRLNADCNGDGTVDNFDINPFVQLLTH